MNSPLHKYSKYFLKIGIFDNLKSFEQLENKIKEIKSHNNRTVDQTKGDIFEVFVEALLNVSLKYNVKKAYPTEKIPREILKKLKLNHNDKGCDGVYVLNDGSINTYQAKYVGINGSLTWSKLSTFIGVSGKAKYKLLISSTNNISDEFLNKSGVLSTNKSSLLNLSENEFKNIYNWLNQKANIKKGKQPDKYQSKTINEISKELTKNDRATCVMACGAGKTLIGLWYFEKILPKITVVFVPSIALIKQIRDDWLGETVHKIDPIAICSATDRDPKLDEFVVEPENLDFQMYKELKDIRKFINKKSNIPKVIFCTYQSSKKIGLAIKKRKIIDLGIFDEAHKTARVKKIKSNKSKPIFSYALDNENIFIKKRLFMTATRRVSAHKDFNKEGDAKLSITMDNKRFFGNVCSKLSFNEAAKLKIIARPKVIISYVTSKEVEKEKRSKSITIVKNTEINSEQVAHQIAIRDAVKKYGINKIFTFHNGVESARSFTKDGPEGIKSFLPEFYTKCIWGAMKDKIRNDTMIDFKEKKYGIMSNARCLIEGVNVPSVGMVAFVNPKHSEIDIIQAIGRALRKRNQPKKRYGYVLIPIYVETKKNETTQEALKRTKYENIALLIKALREHDDEINAIITEILVSEKRGKGYSDRAIKRLEGRFEGIHPHLSKEKLLKEIKTKIINKLRTRWDDNVGMLLSFKDIHGHTNVPKIYEKNVKLGEWVHNVRLRRRLGQLYNFHIDELDKIGFNWMIEGETLKSTKGLFNESYIGNNVFPAISYYRNKGIIKPVGTYWTKALSYYYKKEKVLKDVKKSGVTAINTKGLYTLSALIKKITKKYKVYCSKKIKNAYKNKKLKPKEFGISFAPGITPFFKMLTKSQLKKLLDLDIMYANTPSYISESDATKKARFSGIKKYYKKGLIKGYKGPNVSRPFGIYFKKKDLNKLERQKLDSANVPGRTGKRIAAPVHTWGWISARRLASILGFKTSIPLYSKIKDKTLKPDKFFKINQTQVPYFKNSKKRIDEIRAKLGITLKSSKGLLSLTDSSKKFKIPKTSLKRLIKKKLIIPAGIYPADNGQLVMFFNKKDLKKLKKIR